MFPNKRYLAVLSLLIWIQGGLAAFTFSPISQEFTTEGKNSSHVFTITNDTAERIAVKVSVFERFMDEQGKETLVPRPGDFLIYPAQSLLNPGDSRAVRIKWQGGAVGEKEKAYRLIAEQLPVNFRDEQIRDDGGGIRFTFRYEGSLYVLAPGAEPDIKLISIASIPREEITELVPVPVEPVPDSSDAIPAEGIGETSEEAPAGDPEDTAEPSGLPDEPPQIKYVERVVEVKPAKLKLLFENSGTRHALLGALTIRLESPFNEFEPVTLKPADLAGVNGENLLAGSRRSFLILEPPEIAGRQVRWSFTYKAVY